MRNECVGNETKSHVKPTQLQAVGADLRLVGDCMNLGEHGERGN